MSTTRKPQRETRPAAPARGAAARTPRPGFRTWEAFQRRLTEALAVLEDEHYLVLTYRTSGAFVQFASFGHGGLRAEAVSNASLKDGDKLNDIQLRRLRDLGWLDPEMSVAEAVASGHRDGGGTANHFRDWPHPAPFAEVAALAVVTLREVLGVSTPARLVYRARNRALRRFLLPTLGLNPEPEVLTPAQERAAKLVWPRTWEEVQGAVLALLRANTRDPELNPGEDGEIPVRSEASLVLVRVDHQSPLVHLHSDVVCDVEATPPLLAALNELNRTGQMSRFFAAEGKVTAAIRLDASPFDPEALHFAVLHLLRDADNAGAELSSRFGGRTAFDTARPAQPPAAIERVN